MIFFYETKTITFVPQKIIMTENLTKQTFLEKVFNYEKNKDWMYEGKLACHHRFLCRLVWSL